MEDVPVSFRVGATGLGGSRGGIHEQPAVVCVTIGVPNPSLRETNSMCVSSLAYGRR